MLLPHLQKAAFCQAWLSASITVRSPGQPGALLPGDASNLHPGLALVAGSHYHSSSEEELTSQHSTSFTGDNGHAGGGTHCSVQDVLAQCHSVHCHISSELEVIHIASDRTSL